MEATAKKEENLYTPNCIRTHTGIYMNVFEPTIDMISIEDIAHALSNMPRFGGHLNVFYSVAQHSLNCALLIEDPKLKLATLLHDASEAYLMDMPKPIKIHMPQYNKIEDVLMTLIAEKFKFEWPMVPAIKKVDEQMLHQEWECLMLSNNPEKLHVRSNRETKKDFLTAFKYYTTL